MAPQDKVAKYNTHLTKVSRTPLKWLHNPYHPSVKNGGHVTNHFFELQNLRRGEIYVHLHCMSVHPTAPQYKLAKYKTRIGKKAHTTQVAISCLPY